MNINVCRHSLASHGGEVYSFGGYDGQDVCNTLQHLPLPLSLPPQTNQTPSIRNRHAESEEDKDQKEEQRVKEQEASVKAVPEPQKQKQPVWNTSKPYTLAELKAETDPDIVETLGEIADMEDDEKGKALYMLLHKVSSQRQYNQYVDPASGYTVFTSYFFKKRPCCGNKCRHCPWGHKNVKKAPKSVVDDW